MYPKAEKPKENKSRAVAGNSYEKGDKGSPLFQIKDNRNESIIQKIAQGKENNIPKVKMQKVLPENENNIEKELNKASSGINVGQKCCFFETTIGRNRETLQKARLGKPIQMMHVYRVQDDEKEKKRVTIKSGNIAIGPGPLNISIGYPDHALYFLERGNPYTIDVVEFEIDDDLYYELIGGMTKQKNGDGSKPTFNDVTKPGFKIEIKDGVFMEMFKKAIVQGTGEVSRGAEFYSKHAPLMYNEHEVCDMAKAIIEMYPENKVILRQVMKIMTSAGLVYDNDTFSREEGLDVNWKVVNDELWVVFNKQYEKSLK